MKNKKEKVTICLPLELKEQLPQEAHYTVGIAQKKIIIRLTIRLSDELDKLIRKEAKSRGMNINQTMLYILNNYFIRK